MVHNGESAKRSVSLVVIGAIATHVELTSGYAALPQKFTAASVSASQSEAHKQ